MPEYLFAYSGGARERTERHAFATQDHAIASGRTRVGAVDPVIAISLGSEASAAKRIGRWDASAGLPSWTAG